MPIAKSTPDIFAIKAVLCWKVEGEKLHMHHLNRSCQYFLELNACFLVCSSRAAHVQCTKCQCHVGKKYTLVILTYFLYKDVLDECPVS